MTRLPSDSFLPSGALERESLLSFSNNGRSLTSPKQQGNSGPTAPPGFVSPLLLSRVPSQYSYFDARPQPDQSQSQPQRHIASPMSISGAIPVYPQNFLSPHLQPASGYDRRSVSLSPTRRARGNSLRSASTVNSPLRHPAMGGIDSGIFPLHSIPYDSAVTSHPRAVSADAGPTASSTQLISRLSQQNNRIRETWEAERKYLEANRERVEEVYREERAIMDQERAAWDTEKQVLEDQVRQLRNTVSNLQTQNSLLTKRLELEKAGKMAGISVPISAMHNGMPLDGSVDLGFPSTSSMHSLYRAMPGDSSSSNSGSKGVSPLQNRRHYISPNTSRMSPARQPEVSPFIPLNQHIQPITAPVSDFLAQSKPDGKIPTIDVQELHPELEGIPLRSTAVKKDTFKDGPTPPESSSTGSREGSPPGDASKGRRAASKDHTLQVLNANESARLTMHAGHTPSHSLSLLPTLSNTEVATVATNSGECTPTQSGTDAESHKAENTDSATEPTDVNAAPDEHPKEILEPVEDVKLKAPLMVRNIPAYDEEFFKRVNEKLEKVSSGDDAVPTALRRQSDDQKEPEMTRGREGPAGSSAQVRETAPLMVETEASLTRVRSGSDQMDADDEPDIPLKIKSSLNFGAPLGEMH